MHYVLMESLFAIFNLSTLCLNNLWFSMDQLPGGGGGTLRMDDGVLIGTSSAAVVNRMPQHLKTRPVGPNLPPLGK